MSAARGVRGYRLGLMRALERVRKGAAVEAFSGAISDTPVLSGRARGNWQFSKSAPAQGEIEGVRTEAVTGAEARAGVLDSGPNDVVYLTNNLPYIDALERGTSRKAPNGMARRNIRRVAEGLRRKYQR